MSKSSKKNKNKPKDVDPSNDLNEEAVQSAKTVRAKNEISEDTKNVVKSILSFPQVKTYERTNSVKIMRADLAKNLQDEAEDTSLGDSDESNTETVFIPVATKNKKFTKATRIPTNDPTVNNELNGEDTINEPDGDIDDPDLHTQKSKSQRLSYLKSAISVVVFLLLSFVILKKFNQPQNKSKLELQNTASKILVANNPARDLQIEKDTHYKTSYWENIVYTKDYLTLELDSKMAEKWARVMGRFFEKYTTGSGDKATQFLILEKKLIRDLVNLSRSMHSQNQFKIEEQMYNLETQRLGEVAKLLGSKRVVEKLKKLKGKFYLIYRQTSISQEDKHLLTPKTVSPQVTINKKVKIDSVTEGRLNKNNLKVKNQKKPLRATSDLRGGRLPKKKNVRKAEVSRTKTARSKKVRTSKTSKAKLAKSKNKARLKAMQKKTSRKKISKNKAKAATRKNKRVRRKRIKAARARKYKKRSPAADLEEIDTDIHSSVRGSKRLRYRGTQVIESMELTDLEDALLGDLEMDKKTPKSKKQESPSYDPKLNEFDEIDEIDEILGTEI